MALLSRDGKLLSRDGALLSRAVVAPPSPFEMIVKTDNTGTSEDNQFTIPTEGAGYSYTVETSEQLLTGQTGNVTLEWAVAGTYWVRITGDFPRVYFNFALDRQKLLEVSNWGDIVWQNMNSAFLGCNNFNVTAFDAPNLNSVADMSSMFNNASAFNADLSSWDVSSVTDMFGMFDNATTFNGDISIWNVSSVTSMNFMFNNASAFNGDLSSWNVSSVTDMSFMFNNASTFNRDLSSWCVEQIASHPFGFDTGATAWVLPRPNWGDPC